MSAAERSGVARLGAIYDAAFWAHDGSLETSSCVVSGDYRRRAHPDGSVLNLVEDRFRGAAAVVVTGEVGGRLGVDGAAADGQTQGLFVIQARTRARSAGVMSRVVGVYALTGRDRPVNAGLAPQWQ